MGENSVNIWMPWYPSDYLRDTMILTLEEDAIYRRALDFLWQNPQGIPKETRRLCLALRIDSAMAEVAISILGRYLTLIDGFYISSRVDKERQKAINNRETQRINGQKGGRPPKPTGSISLKPNESPSPSSLPSSTTSTSSPKTHSVRFEVLKEIFGEPKTQKQERSYFDAFQGFLKIGASAQEIKSKAEKYKEACPGFAFTPHAVLNNWDRSEKGANNGTSNDGRSPRRKRLDEDAHRITELAERIAGNDRGLHPAHVPIGRPSGSD